ncbi:MAG TPA: hypothetical protein PK114_06480, partial [Smithellaceae bacterium]|nr:hypothetical protein [Smithellaceae bacterium]
MIKQPHGQDRHPGDKGHEDKDVLAVLCDNFIHGTAIETDADNVNDLFIDIQGAAISRILLSVASTFRL